MKEVTSMTNLHGWNTITLEEIISIKHGFAFKSEHFTDSGKFALLTPGNFFESGGFRNIGSKQKYYNGSFPKEYLLKKGNLLVVMTEQASGLLGSTLTVPDDNKYLHNQRLGLIEITDYTALYDGFLFHLFNSLLLRRPISDTASGTKVRHTSPSKICELAVTIPPLLEQKRIASILSACDHTINLTERLIAAKQERRTWLMQQLLTGKRRLPGFKNGKKLRKTSFGSLPADWVYPRIGEVAKEVSERNGNGTGRPVLSCTKHQGLVDSLTYFGKRIFSEDLSTYKLVRRGQFAYATNHIDEGSIGYQNTYDEALISPIYIVFQTDDTIDDRFLFLILKTETYRHIFASNTSASVDRRGSLRWSDFARIHVPRPTMEEQHAIVRVFETAGQELDLLRQQLDALREQKKGLMQQLLTGKVRVKV
jgi:type I restriction enzyme S subunit